MEFHMSTVEFTTTYWQKELVQATRTYQVSKTKFDKEWIEYCTHMIDWCVTLENLHSDVPPQDVTAQTIQATWDSKLANDDAKLTLHTRIAHVANNANVSIQQSIEHVGYCYVLHTATSTAIIEPNGDCSCTCKDHQYRKTHCKHLYVLSLSITNPTF